MNMSFDYFKEKSGILHRLTKFPSIATENQELFSAGVFILQVEMQAVNSNTV